MKPKVTPEKLAALQRKLDYNFSNSNLLEQALTHKSAYHKNNERLEFLGDSVLNFIIADLLFHQFEAASEGELTRARASLVKKATLLEIALEFMLSDYLVLGHGEQRSGGYRRESILADTLEAIIGAIYIDGGFAEVKRCLSTWFNNRIIVLEPEKQEKDPKTRLQEWLQAHQMPLPQYHVLMLSGDQHCQVFTISCEVEGIDPIVQGVGTSRRFAEQQAASEMLKVILNDNVK